MPFKDPEEERAYKARKHRENRLINLVRMRAYRLANRERLKQKNKEWNENNADRLRAWRHENLESLREKARAWRLKNPEKVREMKRRWRLKNLAKVKDMAKRDREKHKARCKAAVSKWQKANPEKCSVYRKRAYAKNPEAAFNHTYKRRHTLKIGGGKLSRGLSKRLFASQNGLCAICSLPMITGNFHRDHIIPISKGGRHEDGNIQLTHPKCNLSKGAKLPTK